MKEGWIEGAALRAIETLREVAPGDLVLVNEFPDSEVFQVLETDSTRQFSFGVDGMRYRLTRLSDGLTQWGFSRTGIRAWRRLR